jgi:lytic murein transglycosylase
MSGMTGVMLGLVLAAGLMSGPASAQVDVPQAQASFEAFLQGLRTRAIAAGVSAATFDSQIPGLRYNARVIALDRAQPGGDPTQAATIPNFAPYKASHVDASRINQGRARYQVLRPQLARVEAETGVPESIMMAIYGHETGYGSFTGNFDLLGSLATLAFEGRRRDLFTDELIATLLLIDKGVPRSQLKGSWAGATGLPQFLPSVYLRLALDADGDGRADIWNSETDALASIGNYLINAGWKPNVPWGVAVRVPAGFDRVAVASRIVSPRCPRVHARHSQWRTIGEWRTLGIQMMGGNVPADNEMASLLEPDGPGATAYLLTGNYRVILDYNCSNFYALSVGLLADAIAN